MPSSSIDGATATAGAARRRGDFVFAAVLAAIAVAISPFAIERLTGRSDLSPRIFAISLTFDLFLLILIAAALMQGRGRKIALHIAAWVFPVALLAGLEISAVAVRLADRTAPTEDMSVLENWKRWPPHLLSEDRWAGPPTDVRLYRPWRGDGIELNELGLRTALPTPKAPGEWRIVVTGGSAAWGWRVLDADTVPQRLQDALRRTDPKITVYNFGIEGAQISSELALLKRFRAAYGIDQVIFYSGGNDAISGYLARVNAARAFCWLSNDATSFELIKTALRMLALSGESSPQQLALLDRDVVAPVLRDNVLGQGIRAASAYCEAERLRCDFVLQPLMFTRQPLRGSEAQLRRNFDRLYPRLGGLTNRMYADVTASIPPGRIRDFAHVFDGAAAQFFVDLIHLNEAGNRFIAERIAAAIETRRAPASSP